MLFSMRRRNSGDEVYTAAAACVRRFICKRPSASAAHEAHVRRCASTLARSSSEQAESKYASSLSRHSSHVIAKLPVIWPSVIRALPFALGIAATSQFLWELRASRQSPDNSSPPNRTKE